MVEIVAIVPASLPAKVRRTVEFALKRLKGPASVTVPSSIEDFKNVSLTRELRLTGQRTLLMSDRGIAHLEAIVESLLRLEMFEGLADYGDIWNACWKTLESAFSKALFPDSADELVALIVRRLGREIRDRTFVVPFVGVELEGVDSVLLGDMKLLRPALAYFDELRLDHSFLDVQGVIDAQSHNTLWLACTARGTGRVAEQRIRERAELVAGMLAVAAASMFRGGASAFHIGPNMSAQDASGRPVWFSWSGVDQNFSAHYGGRSAQDFKLTAALLQQMQAASTFCRAFRMFVAGPRSPLEECIMRGLYWYSDAHRDPVPVMRFVKYWSCVETFFSGHTDITKSVSTGLASVLVFGGYDFVPISEYQALKKRITALYGLRSRAVHGAQHKHVADKDVGDLSQWVAWMLLNMLSFVEDGYTEPKQLREHCIDLDSMMVP